jgi:hypothetical protein
VVSSAVLAFEAASVLVMLPLPDVFFIVQMISRRGSRSIGRKDRPTTQKYRLIFIGFALLADQNKPLSQRRKISPAALSHCTASGDSKVGWDGATTCEGTSAPFSFSVITR